MLSREENLRSIQQRFAGGDPTPWQNVTLLLGLLGMVLAAAWLVHRLQKRQGKPRVTQPMPLYRRVLRKLDLPLLHRWRMRSLARVVGIRHPAALLVSSKLFDAAVRRYCSGRGLLFERSNAALQFAAIREKLFGSTS